MIQFTITNTKTKQQFIVVAEKMPELHEDWGNKPTITTVDITALEQAEKAKETQAQQALAQLKSTTFADPNIEAMRRILIAQ